MPLETPRSEAREGGRSLEDLECLWTTDASVKTSRPLAENLLESWVDSKGRLAEVPWFGTLGEELTVGE